MRRERPYRDASFSSSDDRASYQNKDRCGFHHEDLLLSTVDGWERFQLQITFSSEDATTKDSPKVLVRRFRNVNVTENLYDFISNIMAVYLIDRGHQSGSVMKIHWYERR